MVFRYDNHDGRFESGRGGEFGHPWRAPDMIRVVPQEVSSIIEMR